MGRTAREIIWMLVLVLAALLFIGSGLARQMAQDAAGQMHFGPTPAALTDSQLVWCKANPFSVAASADALGLAAPSGERSWVAWAGDIYLDTPKGIDAWGSFTPPASRADRDRACAAAFDAYRTNPVPIPSFAVGP